MLALGGAASLLPPPLGEGRGGGMNTLNSDAVADRALHRRELDVVVRRGLVWFTDD